MADPMTDVSSISMPDYIADHLNAFRAGRTAALPVTSPTPTLDQRTNAVTGRFAAPDGPQRDQAARRAELLGAIGVGLSRLPYAQRSSVLLHLAPALANEGIPSQTVVGFDPTDKALAMSIDRAQAASSLLSGL